MMNSLVLLYYSLQRRISGLLRHFDGLPSLALRLYLAPIFLMAGISKIDLATLQPKASVVEWFGNPDWGLGLPYPELMVFMAGWTEILGAVFLLLGILVRLISIPLIVTMLVAIFTVHLEHGWFAIAPSDPDTSMAKPLAALGFPGATESLANSEEVGKRLNAARDILREYGNYSWLSARGSLVILNNGIEFATTYLMMLLSLLVLGGGRYVSLDFWLDRLLDGRLNP